MSAHNTRFQNRLHFYTVFAPQRRSQTCPTPYVSNENVAYAITTAQNITSQTFSNARCQRRSKQCLYALPTFCNLYPLDAEQPNSSAGGHINIPASQHSSKPDKHACVCPHVGLYDCASTFFCSLGVRIGRCSCRQALAYRPKCLIPS